MAGSEQQGFEVAPVRLGGGGPDRGGRRPGRGRMPVIAILVLALAVPAVALAGPRIEWRPEIDLSAILPSDPPPSPDPARPPRPRITPAPTATPLPQLTLGNEPRPVDPIPVHVSSFRLLDAATGELGSQTRLRLDRDVVFPAPGGGWLCMCIDRQSRDTSETLTLTVRRLDRNMAETMSTEIATYRSEARPPAQDWGVRVDLERSPDGRYAYVAVAQRAIDEWRLHVDTFDLWNVRLVGSTDLGVVAVPPAAQPAPSAIVAPDTFVDTYLNGPYIRLAPGGRRALAYGTLETHDPAKSEGHSSGFGWFVDVAGDSVTGVTPMSATWNETVTRCFWLTWLSDVELVAQCWQDFSGAPGNTLNIRSFDPAGAVVADVAVVVSPNWGVGEPVYDRASRTAWMWDPIDHVLHRVDLARSTADRIDPDPDDPQPVPLAPEATARRPDWVQAASALQFSFAPLAVERDGSRIYVAGYLPATDGSGGRQWPGGSSGIWVFDAASFALIDHWPAAAAYTSVALSPNGRWLLAVGRPGVDVAGTEAAWSGSLTVHDTTDGRVAVQFGDLGHDHVLTLR